MLDRYRQTEGVEVLNEWLGGFMKKVGIPTEKLDVYREAVLKEWEHKLANEAGMAAYASLIDFSSPDRNQAIQEQNSRLIEVRIAMAGTEKGSRQIAKMQNLGVDDGHSTIPIPAFSSFQPQSA